jgi:glutathione synthase/RimK-type ligase-like ATP-grasp enzyme
MQKQGRTAGKILIFTLTGDVHVPFVTRHLHSETDLIDPFRMLEKCELSFLHDGRTTQVIYDGQPVSGIKSVWYRRPYIPEREDIKVPAAFKDYAYSALRKHSLDLYSLFQDAFWLTDYYTLLKAEAKPRQLEVAAGLGFSVPKTLTTSSPDAATAFTKEVGDVVVKSMANTLPIINNKVYNFYTTKVAKGQKMNLEGLHLAPSIFQEAIDAKLDLRVTVVDDQIFAASILDQGQEDEPAIRDWRRAYTAGTLRCKAYELPTQLQKRCVALTKALNLRYGAIDLILDKKGKYWFLEINPNGQWAFVEDDTGQPIGKAIAELLENAGK